MPKRRRKRHFNCEAKNKLKRREKNMANISIFKIAVQYGRNEHTKKDFYAVKCREVPGEFEEYLAETGDIYRKADVDYGYHIVAVSRTRGVPAEARKLFSQMLRNKAEQEKARKEKEEAEKKERELRTSMSSLSCVLLDALGLLSNDAFCKAFTAALPAHVRSDVERNYTVRVEGNTLCVVRTVYVQKYFRRASFLEEEYDGTVYIAKNGEKTAEYKRYIAENSAPLPVKAKIKEWLAIGDKDCLIYTGEYVLPMQGKTTKDYAEKLAKKFAG